MTSDRKEGAAPRGWSFHSIAPGDFFIYHGARRLFRSSLFGIGQILGTDEGTGIVFVRTFYESDLQEKALDVAIGFLPIVWSRFRKSVRELHGHRPLGEERFQWIQEWRNLTAVGEAGAFAVELRRAEKLVWATLKDAGPEASFRSHFVLWAYPVRSEDGQLSSVRAAAVERDGARDRVQGSCE